LQFTSQEIIIPFLGKKTISNSSHWILRIWLTRLKLTLNFRDIGYPRVRITIFLAEDGLLDYTFPRKEIFKNSNCWFPEKIAY